ncbi:MAG TPA: hypothetical protein VFT43_05665, partial [Candidatus Polarisedimenticolia bacterium]|nr:hypothetical protein [Candidatus Polarisedimenticolia bacterium]
MILVRQNFLTTALVVFVAAFVLGIGNIMTGSVPASRSAGPDSYGTGLRSGEDGGFSITLASPRDPYLVGRQAIVIDPTLPPGDAIAQVDFFIDGKLVDTDHRPPYAWQSDFGQQIRRHTIIVRALTRGGRRARVSFVSRSGDLSESAAAPVVIVPAVVRDADDRLVNDLSVSDFTLLEDGARQGIVHFDTDPGPASIALALYAAPGSDEAAAAALRRGAAAFAEPLPAYHALGLLRPGAPGAALTLDLSYDRGALANGFGPTPPAGGTGGASREAVERWLATALPAAAAVLKERPGDRVILVLLAAGPPPPAPEAATDA